MRLNTSGFFSFFTEKHLDYRSHINALGMEGRKFSGLYTESSRWIPMALTS